MRQLLFTCAAILALTMAAYRLRPGFALAEGWSVANVRLTASYRTPAVGRHRRPRWWEVR